MLIPMDVTALGWSGTRTANAEALATFYADVLGLQLTHRETDFWVFTLPDGRNSRYSARTMQARNT